jgi:hypothetical protein
MVYNSYEFGMVKEWTRVLYKSKFCSMHDSGVSIPH